ncbi:MAG: copper chaperone [Bacteroidetes bacterium]|jgi:copper chaperone CopZ|nr:copper chaperone [Bacteroidota bacterium]
MNTRRTSFTIDGMNCDHCVAAVRSALADVDGVTVNSVAIGSAAVTYDPDVVSRATLIDAIESAGYSVPSSTRT